MKYRKKPIVIEAIEFTKGTKNQAFNFVRCNTSADFDVSGKPVLKIQTLEGIMTAQLGDWIIKGVRGEFYPCKPDIFSQTYEPVSTPPNFDEKMEIVSGGDLVNHIVVHRPNRHTIFQDCPLCGEDVSKIAIVKLVYTHVPCDCGEPDYTHLVEQLWHKNCYLEHHG